ncbi:MAG TPA: SusE domain-containing protein, partial [Cyclobacteriaceae bacterium]|nr:SusE domain-containing protein [Cyclobacteriaceae bacterium]
MRVTQVRNNKFMVKYITITMKEMKTKYLFSAILGIALVACESDLPTASLNPNATLTTTASDNDIVLTEEMAGDEVLTISWDTPDFGFTASPSYTIYMDKAGDFSDPKTVNVGASTTKTFMAEELNGILLNLDFEAEE